MFRDVDRVTNGATQDAIIGTQGNVHRANEILDYWFCPPGSPGHGERRDIWFYGGPAIDAEIRDGFLGHYERGVAGELDKLRDGMRGCLAMIILFDQFPRNMFRGTPRAFATDPRARELAEHAIAQGFDRGRPPIELTFFYLPFEHSEDLDDQRRSVALRGAMPEHDGKERSIEHAVRHMEVLERFGRFPHRNAVLGRESTAEELSFLAENDDNWLKSQLPGNAVVRGGGGR